MVGLYWSEEPPREAAVVVEFGVPADLKVISGVCGWEQQAVAHVARWWAMDERHWPGRGSEQWHRVRSGAVDGSAEDGELAAAHPQRLTVFIVSVGVIERSGQRVRILQAAGLHDCHLAAHGLKNLDPAVVADDPIATDKDCPPGADRDPGVLPAMPDDLIEVVLAKALPSIPERGIDSEKRLTVSPEPANVRPQVVH